MLAGGPTTRSDKRNYVKTMICLLQNNVKNAWKYLLQIKDMPFSIKPMQYSVEHSTTFWIIKAKILQMKSGIAGRVWEWTDDRIYSTPVLKKCIFHTFQSGFSKVFSVNYQVVVSLCIVIYETILSQFRT